MKKGIVMEMDDSYLTLLTPDGEFLRARKQDMPYSIGEEILFFPLLDSEKSKKSFSFISFIKRKALWVSIASLLFCFGTIFPVYQSNKAYAYMSIEADSSIQLGVNKKMQVVELKGFNEETEKIISQLEDWKKKDVSELTAIILTKLKDEGIIKAEEPVIISAIETEQFKDIVGTTLKKNMNEIKQSVEDQELVLQSYVSTKEEIEKAHDLGVPVGKYHNAKNDSVQNKEKAKVKQPENKQENNDKSKSNSKSESKIPPGQNKKQSDSTNTKIDESQKKSQNNSQSNSKNNVEKQYGNQKAPGQIKKSEGQKVIQNHSKNDNNKSSDKKNENNKEKNNNKAK